MHSITIRTNYWRVPNPENAFDGFLGGRPTEEQRAEIIATAIAERNSWKPNAKAMALVEQLKQFIGNRVRLQFWDPIMYMLEEEGPWPIAMTCTGVELLMDNEFLQAYIKGIAPEEFPTPDGFSPVEYFKHTADGQLLAPLANLYIITPNIKDA